MVVPGSDPVAVAGNHGEVSGGEGIGPTHTPSESSARSGESEGWGNKDDEEVAAAGNQEAGWPDLPSPSCQTSDFFTDASDSPKNQGFEEEEQVGGDSVERETNPGHSPLGLGHADSSSPESATVIDPSPRPWKKRYVSVTLKCSITLD
jgi:hypothetical protein